MIVIAGEALVDIIAYPDGRLVAVPGGGPFNTARTIGRLAQPVGYLGRLSTDRFGQRLSRELVRDGVDLSLVEATVEPTTLAIATIDERGSADYQFYLEGTSAAGLRGDHVGGGLASGVTAVHVGSLGLVLEPTATTLVRLVASVRPDVIVMLDPNCRPSAIKRRAVLVDRVETLAIRADVIKVSVEDLDYLYPRRSTTSAISRLRSLGASVVLATNGSRSVRVAGAGEPVEVAVPRVDVVDTVGAGDAFGGGFLASWTTRGFGRDTLGDPQRVLRSVEDAVVIACETCRRPGAEPPTASEFARLMGRAVVDPFDINDQVPRSA
jgi:fructokinase